MASTYPWNTWTDRGNLLSTSLDSKANAATIVLGSELDNATNKDTHMIIEINLGSLNPAGDAYLELYMIKAPDGTNYEETPVIGGGQINTMIATIPILTGTATKRVMTGILLLPPFKVKFALGNQLNVTTAASGNTLDVYTGILAST